MPSFWINQLAFAFAQSDRLAQEAVSDRATSALNQLHESILTPLLRNDTISQQVALQRVTEDRYILSAAFMVLMVSFWLKVQTRDHKP